MSVRKAREKTVIQITNTMHLAMLQKQKKRKIKVVMAGSLLVVSLLVVVNEFVQLCSQIYRARRK